jgi:hypothetical protein
VSIQPASSTSSRPKAVPSEGRRGDDLILNALPVEFSSLEIEAWVRPFDDAVDLFQLREDAQERWRYRRHQETLYAFRLDPSAPEPTGERCELLIADHPGIVAGLLPPALAALLPQYPPLRWRPFKFRGQRENIAQGLGGQLGLRHALLDRLDVAPRYELDGRVLNTDDVARVVLTVGISTDWRVQGNLAEVAALGLPLAGQFALWAQPQQHRRRLAGEIVSVSEDRAVILGDAGKEVTVAAAELVLEPSLAAVRSLLRRALGDEAASRFHAALLDRVDGRLVGPHLLDQVRYVRERIAKRPIALTDHLSFTLGDPLVLPREAKGGPVTLTRPVSYCFDASRSKRHEYAWSGLERFGPFSGDTFAKRSPVLLVVHPQTVKGRVETFVQALRDGIHGPGLTAYEKGFARTFGLTNPRFIFAAVPLTVGSEPATEYARTIEDTLASQPSLPDAALVLIRDEDSRRPDSTSPYLHSKAALLMAGIPVQEIRLSTAIRDRRALQYILQNVSVALYAKMNGIPWTVDHDLTIADEIVIGIGTAELLETRLAARQRYVGVTTVFRGDGNYLLGHLSQECSYDEYPGVLRDSAVAVLTDIKSRNAWQPGDTVRVVVHSARPPRNVDAARIMADALTAVGREQEIEFAFVQVSREHPFMVFDQRQRGLPYGHDMKGIMAPPRGLVVQTSPWSRLLCTVGPALVKRPNTPLPRPLQIHLHRASTFTDMVYLTDQVLKFTSLTWRSTLPASEPVTIYYSELIANLLARLRHVSGWSPATLRSSLRNSRWFL